MSIITSSGQDPIVQMLSYLQYILPQMLQQS